VKRRRKNFKSILLEVVSWVDSLLRDRSIADLRVLKEEKRGNYLKVFKRIFKEIFRRFFRGFLWTDIYICV
jgi:hypothetical protein